MARSLTTLLAASYLLFQPSVKEHDPVLNLSAEHRAWAYFLVVYKGSVINQVDHYPPINRYRIIPAGLDQLYPGQPISMESEHS